MKNAVRCTVPDCENERGHSNGLCVKHHVGMRVHGTTDLVEKSATIHPGDRFGRLLVVDRCTKPTGRPRWNCICDCGKHTSAQRWNLRAGRVKSCGCFRADALTTHGCSRAGNHTPEYRAWSAMNGRCQNNNLPNWKDYGGRGIRVSDRWKSFAAFLSDMGRRPSPKHSLDRIDVNGNYEPENCRWADRKTQNRNTRRHHFVEYQGRRMVLAEAAELAGIPFRSVESRLRRGGWSEIEALTVPIKDSRRFRNRKKNLLLEMGDI